MSQNCKGICVRIQVKPDRWRGSTYKRGKYCSICDIFISKTKRASNGGRLCPCCSILIRSKSRNLNGRKGVKRY